MMLELIVSPCKTARDKPVVNGNSEEGDKESGEWGKPEGVLELELCRCSCWCKDKQQGKRNK